MLKNSLLIALRHLSRRKGLAALHIGSLAVGIGCCLLLFLYVSDELRFDRFHAKADRTYRVVETRTTPDLGEQRYGQTAPPVGPALEAEFPEVEAAARVFRMWRFTVEHGDTRLYVGDYLFAEPAFFDVFSFRLLEGDARTALAAPGSVVLTERAARTFFGDEPALGKTLAVERLGDVKVTGVLEDLPGNSHLDFSMLVSTATLEGLGSVFSHYLNDWNTTARDVATYVALREPESAGRLQAQLAGFVERHSVAEEGMGWRRTWPLELQPLTDIHLGSGDIEDPLNHAEGNATYLYVFGAIGLFILLIACINYMNLATAYAAQRAKEVGMRKVAGAGRGHLVGQFLGESLATASAATVLGVVLCQPLVPLFNTLTGKTLTADLLSDPLTLAALAVTAVVVGLVSGSYPAFVLSRFRPAAALKGGDGDRSSSALIRKGLVVMQFALSSALIAATMIVQQQLRYVQEKELGFEEDRLVVIDINSGDVRQGFEAVKRELAGVPGVTAVSATSRVPGDWKGIGEVEVRPNEPASALPLTVTFLGADEDFLGTYGVALAAGRNFSAARPADSTALLLNETAARMLGWDDPVGKTLEAPAEGFSGRVIGVVKDFHFASLRDEIGPLVVGYHNNPIRALDYFTVRVSGDAQAALPQLQAVGERFDPSRPFEYNFLDQRLNDFYETERRVRGVAGAGAAVAVLIAGVGLLGLAAHTTARRTKEIGVRKVLGASAGSIVALVARDFFRLVLLGVALAAPFAYLLMQRWLEGFAYRIEIHWSLFVWTALAVSAVALLTVSYHALRAATADPVKALRYE